MRDAQFVRFAAVLVVLAGYVFVFRAGEARLGDQLAENAQVATALRSAERTLADAPRIAAQRRRVRAELGALRDVEPSALVAPFLRDAATVAARHHTPIVTIIAAGERARPVTAIAAQRDGAVPLDLTIEGRYADVLGTVGAFSALLVPANVAVTSIARKNAASADTTVTAILHVILERVSANPLREEVDVRSRPA